MSRHLFQGDPARFQVVAEFIHEHYGNTVRFVADVAGGQGMLCRILQKKYNYDCEVVDSRGWTLRGVSGRMEEFDASMAEYYDLIIGLHPDEATRSVAKAALIRRSSLFHAATSGRRKNLGKLNCSKLYKITIIRTMLHSSRFYFHLRGLKISGLYLNHPKY